MPTMSKEYMQNYYNNKYAESLTCETCGGKYKKLFKSVHERSKKHQCAVEKQIKTTESEKEKEIRELQDKVIALQSTIRIMCLAATSDKAS